MSLILLSTRELEAPLIAQLLSWRREIPLEASCKYSGELLKEHIALPICWTNMWPPPRTFFSITHICSSCDVAFTSSKQGNKKNPTATTWN